MTDFWDRPAPRQAVQAALATALAIAAGTLISGQRYYWAVVAAFIVSIGVGSRGEAIVKALQRLAGTLAGLFGGVLLATAVSGHTKIALGLILVCVFFAFYAFQAAYGAMMFWITLMLSLMYGITGQFQPHLLVVRAEETAAGAAVAMLVTMTVLPIRQHVVVRRAARDFLDAMAQAVRCAGSKDADAALAATRAMQARVQALRNSVGALKRGWIPLLPFRYRRLVRAAMLCAYLARELAERRCLEPVGKERVLKAIAEVRRPLEADAAATASPALSSGEDRLVRDAQLQGLIDALRGLAVAIAEVRRRA